MASLQPDRRPKSNGRHNPLPTETRIASSPLEEVFWRWQDELLGTLYILLGSLREAQEAFEETFLHCWHRRELLSSLRDRKAWIFRTALEIARQRRATAWRRRWRLWNLDNSEHAVGPAPGTPPEDNCSPEIAFWRRTLMELAPEEQEVFLLRQNAQLTYEQIADLLRSPVGVVKAQMHRALAKLLQAAAAQTAPPPELLSSKTGAPLEPLEPSAAESLPVRIVLGPSDSPDQLPQNPKPQSIHILPIG